MKTTSAAPKVSVVLPTFNRSELLRRAINSVLNQSFTDLELIVADDCSTENIRDLVESFHDPRLIYLRREQNGGAPAARNTGVQAARGQFIAFQDSDDEWLEGKLEAQVGLLRNAPADVGLVTCGLMRRDSQHSVHFPAPSSVSRSREYAQRVRMNASFFTQTWLVRREALRAVGPFDEQLRMWDDWDMLLRLTALYGFRGLPQTLVLSHLTVGSVGRNLPQRIRSIARMIEKREGDPLESRKFLGRLHYLLGRFQCLNGDLRGGRRSLIRSITINPRQFRSWGLLLGACMGRLAVSGMLRQRVGAQVQPEST